MKQIITLILVIILAVVAGQFTVVKTAKSQKTSRQTAIASDRLYHVVKVYDGDTIKLDNGEHVRLIGIDTPESHDNLKLSRDVKKLGKGKSELLRMGAKAAAFTNKLLYEKDVKIEFDVEARDRYQRLLAYVYLADGTFVNEKIISEGYAYPLTIPPNVKYAHLFKQRFDEAREEHRGLWRE